jgi:hypothetical protein
LKRLQETIYETELCLLLKQVVNLVQKIRNQGNRFPSEVEDTDMLCKAVIVARLFGIVPERFLLDKTMVVTCGGDALLHDTQSHETGRQGSP